MATVKTWTDDEIGEEISRLIKEACASDEIVYQRLTEFFDEHDVTPKSSNSKTSGKKPIPKAETSSDEEGKDKKTPKRRRGYWGTDNEDGEEL